MVRFVAGLVAGLLLLVSGSRPGADGRRQAAVSPGLLAVGAAVGATSCAGPWGRLGHRGRGPRRVTGSGVVHSMTRRRAG